MIAVIAKIPVKPEKKEEALLAAKELMQYVAKEESTLFHTLNIDERHPDTLVFIERYRDMHALTMHGAKPYFEKFMDKLFTLASGQLEISVLKEIESI